MSITTTQLISIEPLNKIGEDSRGETFTFDVRSRPSYMLVKRKAGTVSGNQYHWGLNEGTKTRIFILIEGTIELHYRHVDDLETLVKTIEAPCKVVVHPFVVHAVKGVTDFVMVEQNSLEDLKEDRERVQLI